MEVGQAISPLESFFDSPQLSVSLKVQIDRTAKWAKYACMPAKRAHDQRLSQLKRLHLITCTAILV